MAVIVTLIKRTKFNNLYAAIVDIVFDASYPTGGEPITPQQLGLTTIDFLLPSPAAGYIPEFDHTNLKLKMFTPTNAQVAHSHTENTAASYVQNATSAVGGPVAAAAGGEVANTTDLSAVTVRVLAMGL